jgi:Protein of unknown function (DUF559)
MTCSVRCSVVADVDDRVLPRLDAQGLAGRCGWLRAKTIEAPQISGHTSSGDLGSRRHGRCYVLMVSSSETILEQQRQLLASIQKLEGLASNGQLGECLRLIEDFESDLGAAMDAPIFRHLQSRLALLHDRIRSLAAAAARASTAPRPNVDRQNHPSAPDRVKWAGVVPKPGTRLRFPNGVGEEIKRILRERDHAEGRRPPGRSFTEDELGAALSWWSPFWWTQEQKLGDYRADFFCPSAELVVEVDGSSHVGQEAYDQQRDAAMEAHGIETLRFPVRDIERNAYAAVLKINRRCAERSKVEAERSLTGDDPGAAFTGSSHSARFPSVRRTDAPSDLSKPLSKSEFRCRLCGRTLPTWQRDSIQGCCRDCV